MVLYQIPILILTLVIVYIFIAPAEPYAFRLFFKLLPMIVIIVYAFRIVPREKQAVHYFLIAGLLLSVLADAIVQWHLATGLFLFVLVHLCYTAGFLTISSFKGIHAVAGVLIGAFAVIYSLFLLQPLRDGGDSFLTAGVIASIAAAALMLFAASGTGNKLALLGAFLFLVSHSVWFWDLYIQQFEAGYAIVMFSYYAAQFFIAVSLYSIIEQNRRIVW